MKEEAHRLGFDLVGACPAIAPPRLGHFQQWLADGFAGQMRFLVDRAEAYHHPGRVLNGARSLLMLGVNYQTIEPLAPRAGQGAISRYAWGADYHDVIHRRLRRLVEFHRRLTPEARVRGVVDTAPLLEREFAELAGLGWVGTNTLLLDRRLGSWLFLAALLTTEELEYDEPAGVGHCGTCRACVDACPTGALVAPYRLDARRCLSYLTIELRDAVPPPLREKLGPWLFGCDVCQEVCPWNAHARGQRSRLGDGLAPAPPRNPLELAPLFLLDDESFRRRFRRTPLWRARRGGLLRNAAIVLGNCPHGPAVPALARGLNDAEPLVRGACAWALGRSSDPAAMAALRARQCVETDHQVQQELRAAMASWQAAGAGESATACPLPTR